jgi:hypothetical protein
MDTILGNDWMGLKYYVEPGMSSVWVYSTHDGDITDVFLARKQILGKTLALQMFV